ncbi:MAG: hypothetical protein ACOYNI_11135 [Acidimicrobiia bacterium]
MAGSSGKANVDRNAGNGADLIDPDNPVAPPAKARGETELQRDRRAFANPSPLRQGAVKYTAWAVVVLSPLIAWAGGAVNRLTHDYKSPAEVAEEQAKRALDPTPADEQLREPEAVTSEVKATVSEEFLAHPDRDWVYLCAPGADGVPGAPPGLPDDAAMKAFRSQWTALFTSAFDPVGASQADVLNACYQVQGAVKVAVGLGLDISDPTAVFDQVTSAVANGIVPQTPEQKAAAKAGLADLSKGGVDVGPNSPFGPLQVQLSATRTVDQPVVESLVLRDGRIPRPAPEQTPAQARAQNGVYI